MPNITKRKNKAGEVISYRIRVSRGYDSEGNKLKPHEMTWKPSPNMTPRQAEKEAQRQALLFEEQCKNGLAGDASRITLAEFVPVYLEQKNGERTFWGFTIVIIRVPDIFADSIKSLTDFGYEYKLSKSIAPWDETYE